MRILVPVVLIAASFSTWPATACSPPPDFKPPTVSELFKAAAYVVHARVTAIDELGDGRRARVNVLEQFKGPPLKSIGAPGEGCGLSLSIGETKVFFLDSSANGHVMAYPIGKRDHEILGELRSLTNADRLKPTEPDLQK